MVNVNEVDSLTEFKEGKFILFNFVVVVVVVVCLG